MLNGSSKDLNVQITMDVDLNNLAVGGECQRSTRVQESLVKMEKDWVVWRCQESGKEVTHLCKLGN